MWVMLLLIMQFKHFFADYLLQGQYMMGKFKSGLGFVLPLLTHVSVHGIFTFSISWIVSNNVLFALILAIFDMTVHFIMDRIKASPNLLGRFKALSYNEMMAIQQMPVESEQRELALRNNRMFWIGLGLDQSVHHVTDIIIVYELVNWTRYWIEVAKVII